MKKRILKDALFFSILFCILYLLGFLFVPKNNTLNAGVHDYDVNAFGVLAEPTNSLDVLFIGDSEAYCAFNPLRIWEKSGIASYTVTSVDQQTFETEEYLHMALENQRPKIVIMETNALYRGASRADAFQNSVTGALPVLRYHDRWKSLYANDWFTLPQYTSISKTKGYNLKDKIKPANTKHYMEPTDELEPILSGNLRRLRSMRDFCQKNGADFWLVSTPSTLNWDCYRHNAVQEAADALDIPYIDLNIVDTLNIQWDQDTMDRGDHMNYYGAIKVSDYMTTLLQSTGKFQDKRNAPEYQDWNLLLEPFRETCLKRGLELQP